MARPQLSEMKALKTENERFPAIGSSPMGNGPEFIANDLQGWLRRVGVKPIQIYPATPAQIVPILAATRWVAQNPFSPASLQAMSEWILPLLTKEP